MDQDQGVHARLISLTETGIRYEIKKEQRQVHLGRHPQCEITIADKRVSGQHLRIYRDDDFRYFVEELSANGCYINDHFMKKGETKSLQHGDEISIGVQGVENTKETIANYIFRVADHESDSSKPDVPDANAEVATTSASREGAGSTSPAGPDVQMAGPGNSKLVTEQWVREHWDTRTVLGSGNFSEVRLGVHVQRGEKRAVKVIDKKKFLQFQNKRETQLTLSSEADVLLNLNHPGIVGFYEWFETEQHLYLVMELLLGGDLLQCILEHGCFTETTARRLFRELCDAVKYLHTKHIVHRDLKPENILLTKKDRHSMHLKIADFGLARMNMKSKDCRTFCGTPHYFAPEVINTFRDRDTPAAGYGKQADMWSLGVILYIMLSGIPPFEEDGLYEQILEGKYEFDVREWTTVSPEAKQLIRSLMTVNPKDRLTIDQACEHRWLNFGMMSSCQSPRPTRPLPPAFSADIQPMQIAAGEPLAKRRRTEDAPMSEVTEHSPLGA
jgi:serine/threonine protein kinase